MKTCTRCKRIREESDFGWCMDKGKLRMRTRCNECVNEEQRIRGGQMAANKSLANRVPGWGYTHAH